MTPHRIRQMLLFLQVSHSLLFSVMQIIFFDHLSHFSRLEYLIPFNKVLALFDITFHSADIMHSKAISLVNS